MKGVGQRLEPFKVIGVKPGYNNHEEDGTSAFESLTELSFKSLWKVIYFYPKDFTVVCPTEITGFASLNSEFNACNSILMGGSTDNEHCKLAWRRSHSDLDRLNHWSFADTRLSFPSDCDDDGICRGNLIDQLGVRDMNEGVALRATFIINPDNVIQHVSVNNLDVGRNPAETLRILKALQEGGSVGCPI